MGNIRIQDEKLHDLVRRQAKKHHRSAESELTVIVEQHFKNQTTDQEQSDQAADNSD